MLADLRPPLLVWRNPLIDFFVKEIPLPFPKIGFEVKEWISGKEVEARFFIPKSEWVILALLVAPLIIAVALLR